MAEAKKEALKSAYDLAMGRLAQKGGALVNLTAEQKAKIADIGVRTKAKIAEAEILFQKRIADAQGAGGDNQEALKTLEANKAREIAKLHERAETEKREIREGK